MTTSACWLSASVGRKDMSEHIYIFFDENTQECHDVAALLDRHSLLFTKIPSRAIVQCTLNRGQHSFDGMEEILRGLKYLKVLPEDAE